jgi:hypothetical protein
MRSMHNFFFFFKKTFISHCRVKPSRKLDPETTTAARAAGHLAFQLSKIDHHSWAMRLFHIAGHLATLHAAHAIPQK